MNSINWPVSSAWVFIAQLGEHCSANAEATGSNPVEAPKIFFRGLFSQLLKLRFTAMVTYSFHLYSRSSKSFHSVFHSFHGLMNSINWPAASVWVFIAQLGELCSANAEATGSNPVEAPKIFFRGLFSQLLKLRFTAMVTYSFHLYSRSSKSFHSVFHSFHGLMNSINWPAASVWVFIAQLGEHCSANAEATGSNPVEAPKIFFRGLFSQLLKLRFTAMVTYSFHLYSRSSKSFHSVFHSFHGLMNSINWPAASAWVFIAQLGELCSANAEATGSNPVEAPKIFFRGLFSQLLKLRFTAMVTYSFHLYSRSSKSFHSVFHSFHGLMNSINWPAASVWVFIAQLGEHCSANAEATGSNPVEAPKIFFRGLFSQLLKLRFTAMVTYSFHLYHLRAELRTI